MERYTKAGQSDADQLDLQAVCKPSFNFFSLSSPVARHNSFSNTNCLVQEKKIVDSVRLPEPSRHRGSWYPSAWVGKDGPEAFQEHLLR